MKKYIYSTLLLPAVATLFTACHVSDDDFIFSESAAQRLNNAEKKYSSLLTSSQYGWAFEYYPTNDADDGALLYALKFNADGTVLVAGDPFVSNVVQEETSLWDIILDQGPVLSFSTYNKLIHDWANPEPDGKGYQGDYEFSFVYDETENQDSVINLRGKKRGLKSRLKMIDENVTPKEYLLDVTNFQQSTFPEAVPNYLLLHLGDSLFRIDRMFSTTPEIYPLGKDAVFFAKINSYITTKYNGCYSLRFNNPFTTADGVSAKVFIYDPVAQDLKAENDSRIRISAPDALDFLLDNHAYQWTRSGNMSQKLKDIHANMNKGFTALKYTLNTLALEVSGEDVYLNLSYRNNRNVTSTVKYLYKKTVNPKGSMTLAYDKAIGNAEGVLNAIPAIKELIEALNDTFTCVASDHKLNLTKVNLVSVSEPDEFINMTFAK